ncbi:unnamed protein product [Brachionus calyciflorus]|uniref:Uncharacterized protein n=1 Tax=Brachionus calyciflorus TaxID=104777 RepID=A0A814GTN6_9BILA|nr:unnamed protein product [Brachionus calyciflorus]
MSRFEVQLKACFNKNLEKNVLNKDLVKFIDAICNSKSLPFASVFGGLLTTTSSICSNSFIRIYKDSDDYDVPFSLYLINVGLASSNKSCCTDLFKEAFRKMEKFLAEDENIKNTSLDNSATIEALLESLSKPPHSRYQIWDELGTLISSFGLYKPGGGGWDRTFFLTLHNGPKNLLHSTKKYSYDIDNPRLSIFASSHPDTISKLLVSEKQGADAFICRFLIHVFKAERRRLDKLIPFNERFSLDVVLSCIKVLHSKPMFYVFAGDSFTYLSDVCEEYDLIADENEISLPYIAYVYGKSKTHLIRIIGCLSVLNNVFKVLSMLETIPQKKEDFIDSVLGKFFELQDSLVIDIDVVRMAVMVMDYFIDHKLILSDLERVKNSESKKFVEVRIENTQQSNTQEITLSKKTQTLQQRILLTPGSIVFLTPLSRTKHATSDSFSKSGKLLEEKGLGEYGSFLASSNSTRAAKGFKKLEMPTAGSEEELRLVNALFDFGCSLSQYEATLKQDIIQPFFQPQSTPGLSRSLSSKRLPKDTSLYDITNTSKISRQEDDYISSESE